MQDSLDATVTKLRTAVAALREALDKAAMVTGAETWEAVHDQLEERRKLIDEAKYSTPNPAMKERLFKQAEAFNHVLLNMQLSAHELLKQIEADSHLHERTAQATSLAAALSKVG
jgi:hypothetical protein